MGLKKAKEVLKRHIEKGHRLALAVSGGSDSMCLFSLIKSCDFIDKDKVFVVNVNHNIRGENSDKDSEFVKQICAEFGIEFKGFSVDVPRLASESGRSIESEARKARYDIFLNLKNTAAADYVLTAHHADDNVESILMHLLRGSGINGLIGMEEIRDNYILRPLIYTKKEEIEKYLKEKNIPFVTDETNSDINYTRNYIRHNIIPAIKEKYPGYLSAILNLSKEATDTLNYIKDNLDKDALSLEDAGDTVLIKKDALKNKVTGAQHIFDALKILQSDKDIDRKNINDILQLVWLDNGSSVSLPNKLTAIKEYSHIAITRKIRQKKYTKELPFMFTRFEMLEKEVSIESTFLTHLGAKEIIKNNPSDDIETKQLYFDTAKIPPTATVRGRSEGDMFTPYGGGTKKLKEYLIDKKVPRRLRDRLVLVCDGNKVLMIAGMEISDLVKITDSTEIVGRITIKDSIH